MMTHKIRLISAAVGLLALATTVGVARTVHTHMTAAQQAQAASGKVMGVPPQQNASPRHGILTCGTVTDATACEKLEMMLPM
jgi:hypothetical protein